MKEISRNDVKFGMIAQSGGNIFIQKAIKFFTRSKFSHSFLIMHSPYEEAVLQTTEAMVTITPVEEKFFGKDYCVFYDIEATMEEKVFAIKQTYIRYSGMWYGYLSYVYFIMRYFGYKKDCPHSLSWGVTCTELVCYYLMRLNENYYNLFKGKDLSSLTPEDLRIIIEANKGLFKEQGWINYGSYAKD